MIGYLLAGLFSGPHAMDWIHGMEDVQMLGELGVMLLMFHLGMEFDLGRLRKLLTPSVLAVTLQTAGMLFLGFQVAPLLGWDSRNGFFLGSLLAISSSMVTVRVLQESGKLKLPEGQLVVGILILEDILAVLLLVVLSGVGLQGSLSWGNLFHAIFLVAVFVAVFFTAGRLLMPRLSEWIARTGEMELLTLFGMALALGLGLLAARFGLSLALGAFVAGATLSQTRFVKKIVRRIEPVRGLSGAIFFASVGMRIDPQALLADWKPVIGLSLGVILVKVSSVWLGLFLSGEKPMTSLKASTAKPQIGEFSFVIAALGMSLGVTDERLLTLAVGIAFATILATPFLHKNAFRLGSMANRWLPETVRGFGRIYHDFAEAVRSRLRRASILEAARPLFYRAVLYFFLLNGVYVIGYVLAGMMMGREGSVEKGSWQAFLIWSLAGAVSLPILIAAIFNLNRLMNLLVEHVLGSKAKQSFGQGRLALLFEALSTCVLVALAGGAFFSFASPYLPDGAALAGYCAILVLAAVLLWSQLLRVNLRLEKLFLKELDEQLRHEDEVQRETAFREIAELYPWPVQVVPLDIGKGVEVVGTRILDLDLRRRTGASILAIARSGTMSYEPAPETPFFPGDRVFLFGTSSQIKQARKLFEKKGEFSGQDVVHRDFGMEKIFLAHDSPLVDTTLAGLNLRKTHGINVLAVQRGETRIAPPDGEEILREGDVLFIFGKLDTIRALGQ